MLLSTMAMIVSQVAPPHRLAVSVPPSMLAGMLASWNHTARLTFVQVNPDGAVPWQLLLHWLVLRPWQLEPLHMTMALAMLSPAYGAAGGGLGGLGGSVTSPSTNPA